MLLPLQGEITNIHLPQGDALGYVQTLPLRGVSFGIIRIDKFVIKICHLSICQTVKGGIFLLHRHLLVIAQIDALWQTGEVGAYVLAVECVDLIGCWVIGVG